MVNQICIAGLVQGLAEGLHFAKKAGLDVEKLIATISKGAAQSWQMENRYKTMAAGKFDFGFAVDWMRKDLGHLPRRGAAQRRASAGHRAGRPVLFRGAEDGRPALGYVEPDCAAAAIEKIPAALMPARAPHQAERLEPAIGIGRQRFACGRERHKLIEPAADDVETIADAVVLARDFGMLGFQLELRSAVDSKAPVPTAPSSCR